MVAPLIPSAANVTPMLHYNNLIQKKLQNAAFFLLLPKCYFMITFLDVTDPFRLMFNM